MWYTRVLLCIQPVTTMAKPSCTAVCSTMHTSRQHASAAEMQPSLVTPFPFPGAPNQFHTNFIQNTTYWDKRILLMQSGEKWITWRLSFHKATPYKLISWLQTALANLLLKPSTFFTLTLEKAKGPGAFGKLKCCFSSRIGTSDSLQIDAAKEESHQGKLFPQGSVREVLLALGQRSHFAW